MTLDERITICENLREKTAEAIADIFKAENNLSEIEFREKLLAKVFTGKTVHPGGWYDPPPGGIAALFSNVSDFRHLQFDTLRKNEFWPSEGHIFEEESIGIVYASPVDIQSGTIGDFGMTVYRGKDEKIIAHLKNCLEAVMRAAQYAEVGMEFREIHDFAQKELTKRDLTNARTIAYTDTIAMSIGHTVPWSYEEPTEEELEIIRGNDFHKLRNLISSRRVNLNREEKFKVPPTIAFTVEIRAESLVEPDLPNIFFHSIVTFSGGAKRILTNFDAVFRAAGMDYMEI